MKKIILSAGVITGLGLVLAVSGNVVAQYQKASGDHTPDSLRKSERLSPPAPPLPPLPPLPPMGPVPPAPPAPPVIPMPVFGLYDLMRDAGVPDDSLGKKLTEKQKRALEAELKKRDEEIRKAEIEIEKAEVEISKSEDEMRKAEQEMERAEIEIRKAEQEMLRAEIEMYEAEIEMARAHAESEKSHNIHESILRELNETLGKEVTEYELDNNKLTVHGKKQPADLHKRFSEKYIRGKMSVSYMSKNGKKITTYHMED